MSWLEGALHINPAEAGRLFGKVFGDGMTAQGVGGGFTCTEAEDIAAALKYLGHPDDAATFLVGHAYGDDDPDDDPDHRFIAAATDWDGAHARARDHLK